MDCPQPEGIALRNRAMGVQPAAVAPFQSLKVVDHAASAVSDQYIQLGNSNALPDFWNAAFGETGRS
jgi:hypothetical protein